MDGTIKSYGKQRYGYIVPSGGGPEVWFHGDRVEGIAEADLRPGFPVTYELVRGKKKPQAAWVRHGSGCTKATAGPPSDSSQPEPGPPRGAGEASRDVQSRPEDRLPPFHPGLVYPYSFVRPGRPASWTRPTGHDRYTGLCGRITCELIPLTPLCVPDSERVTWELDGQHPRFPFFRVGDQPSIPGSSIKGAVRSLFETITQSAWSVVDLDPVSYRLNPRVGAEQRQMMEFHAAKVISLPAESGRDGRVALFERVERIPLEVARRHQEGEILTWNGFTGGLHLTGDFPGKKRHEMLFGPVPGTVPAREAPLPYESARLYDKMHEVLGTKGRKFRRLHAGALVYVRLGPDGKVAAIADTRVPRVSYPSSIGDLLGRLGTDPGRSFLPPTDVRAALDPASRLFGVVGASPGQGGDAGYMGQLRFSTARGGAAARFEWRTLRILGEPHPTSFAFYLQHNEAPVADPTPLSRIMEAVRLPGGRQGHRSVRYGHAQARLRGRKFYWNHPAGRNDPEEYALDADPQWEQTGLPVKSDQNATVELLMPGSGPFIFQVDYEGLADWELGALLWSLCPSWPDRSLTLRVGRGKPLGLGTVEVSIRTHEVHNRVERYRELLARGARSATREDHERWTLAFFEWLVRDQTGDGENAGVAMPATGEELARRLNRVREEVVERLSWWEDLLRLLDSDGPPPASDGSRPPIRYPRFYALDQAQGRRANHIGRRTFEWFRPYKEGDPEPRHAYAPLASEVTQIEFAAESEPSAP